MIKLKEVVLEAVCTERLNLPFGCSVTFTNEARKVESPTGFSIRPSDVLVLYWLYILLCC